MRATSVGLVGLLCLAVGAAWAVEEGWPREMETQEGVVRMYQPQIESFSGASLEARAAVSVTPPGGEGGPEFGAVWIEARVDTDRDNRIVTVREIRVPQVRFPDATDEQRDQLARFLEREIPKWEISMSLDRLVADLGMGAEDLTTPGLRHDPPVILHSTEPAILVLIDGDPILQKMEDIGGADLERVVNTPFLIVRHGASKTHYLSGGGELWYSAREILGPWQVATSVPQDVARLAPEEEPDPERDTEGPPPKIIVATEPTELIVIDGEPSWSPVEGMDLLYMDNTDSDVFLEISTQYYYVVLSGRWYRAKAVENALEWNHVPNDELPEAFSDIPEDSANGSVLTYVSGTVQAREAALDNSIPQTTAIRRDDTSLEVTYDGDPQFEPVEDVNQVRYAVNTPSSVFKVSDRYYACEQGVWYWSSSATGPWLVATKVPDVLYDIPSSNPHHNVTYVYVYETTPEVVYVGYPPSYYGSYHYHGCVVWGTGWWYQPWYGHHYYPRSWTWGFHLSYNPWTGWGFGLSFSNGPFTFSVGRYSGGGRYYGAWFGVGGYRPYPRPYVGIGFSKTTINVNRNINVGGGGGRPGGERPGGGEGRPSQLPADRGNLYDRGQNRDRNAERPQTADRQRPNVATGQANNVLTDRQGNVYRRGEDGGWQQRQGGDWKKAEGLDRGSGGAGQPSTREGAGAGAGGGRQPGASQTPSGRQPGSGGSQQFQRPSGSGSRGSSGRASSGATRPQLERDYSARQRGNQRAQSYQRSGASRGGGARRGGGGRRR